MTVKSHNFWLNEEELKTPIHDSMVLETFKNCREIMSELSISWEIELDNETVGIKEEIEKIIEYPLKGYNGFNLGYLDLMCIFKIRNGCFKDNSYQDNPYLRLVGFEIKPAVKSIGEVLRQFQYYKSNLPKTTKLILVTKTKGLKDIFESQGFYVWEMEEKDGKTETFKKESKNLKVSK